ncbi:MAG: gamma-glutamylcyclotransferase family protein [Gammaproteobacteria bacterium]|jgi:gamma-glutamylcyclotransferase (GGCT)/AIG2-like uncharacterized protein YtfP
MQTFSVFTYGTLQFPEVMQAVTGLDLKPVAANLSGYQRFKIKERTFPGLIKKQGIITDGMLYRDLDEAAIENLDLFEDVMYERCLADVKVGNETEQAFVYVTQKEYEGCLLDQEWSLEEFRKKYLKLYLKRIVGF